MLLLFLNDLHYFFLFIMKIPVKFTDLLVKNLKKVDKYTKCYSFFLSRVVKWVILPSRQQLNYLSGFGLVKEMLHFEMETKTKEVIRHVIK